MDDRSKVLKFAGFRWDAVPVKEYKSGDAPYKGVTRHFEVQPGGYSTLERHQHPHAVVVLRGRGCVALGERSFDIAPFDCVYVSPGVAHQFRATGNEPLGFVCTVDRVRDRPEVVSRSKKG